jgi:uncharacterized membrane protein YedE/YeeE
MTHRSSHPSSADASLMNAPTTMPADMGAPSHRSRPLGQVPALLVAFVAGCIFAAGLTMSGMTQPEKIIAFLDIKEIFIGDFPGNWDASLLFVVLGALAIALLGFALTPYASIRPWFAAGFMLSSRRRIDGRLIAGAILFGIGWGLGGYSPATALASLLTGQIDTVVFVLAMLLGVWLAGYV